MTGGDPVAVYAELEALRDSRFDAIVGPELTRVLVKGARDLIAVLRGVATEIEALPDGDPAKRGRRVAEAEVIQQTIARLGGTSARFWITDSCAYTAVIEHRFSSQVSQWQQNGSVHTSSPYR